MSDIITGLRQVIQDMVAPDLKAQAAKLDALQKQLEMLQRQSEIQTDAMMKNIDAFRAEMRSEFASLRANNQMEVSRQMMPIMERVAVLETRAR